MKAIMPMFVCAMIPVALIAAPGFIGGYFGGFGLDCRGTQPGFQSALASAAFTLVFAAPVTIPSVVVGATVGAIGIRRGRRALYQLLVRAVLGGILAGTVVAGAAMAILTSGKTSANPGRLLFEALVVFAAVGGLLGLLAALVAVLVWRRRDNPAAIAPATATERSDE